ncbi:MAG: hypothetical protein KIG78_04055 [Bacteroidaceae bacterium]|nr:hypothetical protein [Bacteroidaceae bacterium]
MAKNIIKDFHSLKNSTMSYPTWEMISKMLAVENVAPNWGDQGNAPLYSVINKDGVETPCGIDIPILLEPNNKTKDQLIIILGESALRTDDEIEEIKQKPSFNTILGTPYALHLKKCPPKCAVYRIIFDALLKEGYSLYITDIIKVWWKGKKGNMLVPDDLDINIFEQELQQFKNPIIVAWGKKSKNALKHRLKKKPDFLPLPHPGVNNWDSWKLRIFMKAVFNNNLEYAKKIYGKGPIGNETKTDEGIVADEAVRSIIEYLSAVKQK